MPMYRWIFILVLHLNGSLALKAADPRQHTSAWQVYGGDFAGTKYSALDQIKRSNVHLLKPVWI